MIHEPSKAGFRGNGSRFSGARRGSKLIFAFGVEQLMRAVVVGFGDEDFRGAVQVAVVGQRRVGEFLRGGNAVLFEHDDEHLGVDDRTGVKKLHATSVTADERG